MLRQSNLNIVRDYFILIAVEGCATARNVNLWHSVNFSKWLSIPKHDVGFKRTL